MHNLKGFDALELSGLGSTSPYPVDFSAMNAELDAWDPTEEAASKNKTNWLNDLTDIFNTGADVVSKLRPQQQMVTPLPAAENSFPWMPVTIAGASLAAIFLFTRKK